MPALHLRDSPKLQQRSALGPGFSSVWTAFTISALGSGAAAAALPLVGASLSHDPRVVSGLTVAAGLPWLCTGLFAGVLVDRSDRARLMVLTDIIRGVLAAIIAVFVMLGEAQIWMLYIVCLGMGVAETVFDNASQALLPDLVESRGLEAANSRTGFSDSVGKRFIGPLIGSAIFAVAASAPFWIDSASFLFSVALLIVARRYTSPFIATPGEQGKSVFRDIGVGFQWLWRHRIFARLAALVGILNLFTNFSIPTLVLFSEDYLHLSQLGYGMLLACFAVGGLLGIFLTPLVTGRLGVKECIVLSVVVNGLTQLLIGFSRSALIVAGLIILCSCAGLIWNTVTISLRQRMVPTSLLGRVNSVYRTIAWATIPIGALAGGAMAHAWGLRVTWLAGGIGILLAGVLLLPGIWRDIGKTVMEDSVPL
ncbi:MFS transporter [Frankia gtarii]|nr:MFS transporter [Frankia gtarii]